MVQQKVTYVVYMLRASKKEKDKGSITSIRYFCSYVSFVGVCFDKMSLIEL